MYLEMCREVAIIRPGIANIRDVPDRLRVLYKGSEYYPIAYQLGFRKDGSATHTAILHELDANAAWYVELDRVTKKENASK